MIRYIDKIYTFLVVYENGSFSSASKKLKVTQPAVTQQIRQLEEFVGSKLIERKKNGIILTKKGQYFLEIAKNLQECIDKVSNRIQYFKEKSLPFIIGASSTVGNYILPNYLPYLKELIKKEINLLISNNNELINNLINNKIDIAFTTTKPSHQNIKYFEWIDDEIVFFSNKPLPPIMEFDDLLNYEFLCREEGSILKQEISKILQKYNKDCYHFNVKSYVNNSTALKYTILNSHSQLISIISKNAIKEEIKSKKLFITKIKGIEFKRKIYMAILQEDKISKSVIDYLLNNK